MLLKKIAFTFLVVVFAAHTAFAVQDSSWPQLRGADGTNRSNETGLFANWDEDGPELAWTAEGLGNGYASVSVFEDQIFTTGNFENNQSVVAIGIDGKVSWTQPITDSQPKHGYEGSRSTPTYDDGHVYAVASSGAIVCLKADDGSIVWKREFSDWKGTMMSVWGFSESPVVDGDNVLCTPGGFDGMVVALNKKTGEEVWVCKLPQYESEEGVNGKDLKDGAGYASIIISQGAGVKQYIQLVGRGLIGIRASDGKLLWRYRKVANGTANIPNAIVDGDLVFTSTGYGTGSALLKLTSAGDDEVAAEEVYWLEGREFQNKHGGMTLVEGHIYCGHGNGKGMPICAEMATGEIKWGPERGKGKGEASTVYADGHVVIRRDNGTVTLIKATPEKFDVVGSFMPAHQEGKSWAHPVIAGGMLYLREQGKLMAYRLK